MEKQDVLITVNPATGEKVAEYKTHSAQQLDEIFSESRREYLSWRRTPFSQREQMLEKLAEALLEKKYAFANLMQTEMGKSTAEALAEIEKCASCARYYAKNGAGFLASEHVKTEAQQSYVAFEPLGTVLAIMPWNFPFWQAIRCAAPAILAGNTVVLKHASNVTGCAIALEKLFQEASGKAHLFRTVLVAGKNALSLIPRPEVKAVSLTGSTEVGRQVAAIAGHELKKCVLELGGSDAYIVLSDADLGNAAQICAQSRLINAGQSCIAAKRFIVEANVLEEFTKLFLKEIQARPLAPLARGDLRAQLHAQVGRAIQQGAQLLCGGQLPEGPGYYYPATVLSRVSPGNIAFDDELFGPVAALVSAKSEEEAVALANLSPYGLGAAVFTKDPIKAEQIAKNELEAGSCFANALVRSDPRLPFGGIKDSGFGRELAGFGIREFVNIKTVYLD